MKNIENIGDVKFPAPLKLMAGDEQLLWRAQKGLVKPMKVYDDLVVEFLNDLSRCLRGRSQSGYADVSSVSFWCRKSNIQKMRDDFFAGYGGTYSLGRGLIFHVAPSNVPVNFAFSFFFGLLSGNANIVRLPSKEFGQVDVIIDAVNELFSQEKYKAIEENTAFVRYGHEQEITGFLCSVCDGRVIWGGDNTIRAIRNFEMKPKGVEVVFADRYSLGVIDSDSVVSADDDEVLRLAAGFYNDTYLMDQNACSTPHLLLWQGSRSDEAKERFWTAVSVAAQKYDLEPIKAVDKYTDLMLSCMESDSGIDSVKRYGNLLYVVNMAKLPQKLEKLRGRFGMFYQYDGGFDSVAKLIDERIQSVMYYGVDRDEIAKLVVENRLTGVDRIVPFGSSLDINVNWDGYDVVRQLCRRIVFE